MRVAFQTEIWGGGTMPPYKMGTMFLFFRVKGGQGVKLTIHFHYVPRLKISGALPPWNYVFLSLV